MPFKYIKYNTIEEAEEAKEQCNILKDSDYNVPYTIYLIKNNSYYLMVDEECENVLQTTGTIYPQSFFDE